MPEDEGGVLNEEILSWIGKEGPPATAEVTKREIRQYATAVGIGQPDPLFTDEAYAKDTPYGGIVAPFLFHNVPFSGLRHVSESKEDGIPAGSLSGTPRAPIPLPRTMAGGTEVEYIRPIRPGDVLTQKARIADITERRGSSGPLVFTTTETTYTDASGQPVVIVRSTTISR